MNAKTLAQVIIRVWGVMLVVGALASSGNILLFLPGSGEWRSAAVGSLISVLISLAAGVYFLRQGDKVGAWLASDLEDAGAPATSLELLSAALAVLGVYFLIIGLRSGAAVGFELLSKPKWDETSTAAYVLERQRQALVSAAVDTIAGVVLLVGHHHLVAGWSRLWRSVRSRPPEPGE